MTTPTTVDTAELRRKVDHWVESGGRQKLAQAARRAREASAMIEEALRPDPDTLNKPMTL